jgi:hypothetical protein
MNQTQLLQECDYPRIATIVTPHATDLREFMSLFDGEVPRILLKVISISL